MLASSSHRYRAGLWVICVLTVLAQLASTTGLMASDDLSYSYYAKLIADLAYHPEPIHFALRYGLIVPLGMVYRLLGVSELSTVLVPFLASVGSVLLLMSIARKLFGSRPALIAGILLGTFPVALHYATICVPEPVAQFYMLAGILAYLHSDDAHGWAFAGGLLLGLAYLTKEPAAFVVPAVLVDAIARRRWRACALAAIGALTMVIGEHLYYIVATGDSLYRPHALGIHNETPEVLYANANLPYRLVKAYPRMMLVPNVEFGAHSLVSLVLAGLGLVFVRVQRPWLLVLAVVCPWLYLNFGTSSFSKFIALPVGARYIALVYWPLFLIAAVVIDRLMGRPSRLVPAVGLALVAALGVWSGFVTRQQETPHTDEVAVLRVVAKHLAATHVTAIRTEGPQRVRWAKALTILDSRWQIQAAEPGGSTVTLVAAGSSQRSPSTVVIRDDQLHLPALATE